MADLAMLADIQRTVYPDEVTRHLHVMAQAGESSPVIDLHSNHCAMPPAATTTTTTTTSSSICMITNQWWLFFVQSRPLSLQPFVSQMISTTLSSLLPCTHITMLQPIRTYNGWHEEMEHITEILDKILLQYSNSNKVFYNRYKVAQWCSGKALDLRSIDHGFKCHRVKAA